MLRRAAYWGVVAVMLGVYGAMVFWTLPAISDAAGGMMPFDLRPTGYSGHDVRVFLAALSADGRDLYLGPQRLLDLAYPALLAVVLIGAFVALVRARVWRNMLILAALGGMAADYVENAQIVRMLTFQGPIPEQVVALASGATVIKSALIGVAMIGLVVALVLAGVRNARSR